MQEFFIRFNLHNSICGCEASPDILKPFVGMEEQAIREYLEKINRVHIARADALSVSHKRETAALKGMRVLFLGDSITSDNLGYRKTVCRAAELEATDGSVSGGMSSWILHSARTQITKRSPEIVSLMIGTNDSVGIDSLSLPQVSIEEYRRNVSRIVEYALSASARVLMFEIPPIHEERFYQCFTPQFKVQSNENIAKYNAILQDIAKEYKITLVSNAWISQHSERDSLFEPDGIHLSVKGQELFAEKWLSAAYKIL